MDIKNKEYIKLFKQGQHIRTLEGISSLLGWDQETYMPAGAAEIRGKQMETLAGIIHQEKVSRKFSSSLGKLIDIKTGDIAALDLSQKQKKALKEWRRDYLIEKALPKKFVQNFAKITSDAVNVWREAREKNDFSLFEPYLKKIITLNRRKADYIGFKDHPYDALLDLYEPGMTVQVITPIFEKLKESIILLLKKIEARPQVNDQKLFGNYPEIDQLLFSQELLKKMGFDFNHGRLDKSTHPFSSAAHPTDSRITTRLQVENIFSCIGVILHEAGHSLYEMGLPIDQYGSPLGDHISMGIHESQSRFWETRIGQSKPFIDFILPLLQKHFENFKSLTNEECYLAINKVQPSLIRVDADEVTYPLHVILRYEIEKGLLDQSINVKDIPALWNEKMQKYLGLTPPSNKLGCLQDVHWSIGAIGYFPTYALGNLYAAMIFSSFAKEFPDWAKKVAHGDLKFIKDYLQKNVFSYGREYQSQELIENITHRKFTSDDYIDYLTKKYKEIYTIV